jgi:hypothetical protein
LFDFQEVGGGEWGRVKERKNMYRLKDAINLNSPIYTHLALLGFFFEEGRGEDRGKWVLKLP